MVEIREDLKNLQIEILSKFCVALESIPLPVLEQFPKFDSNCFKKLQGLHRHVKAKLRLVQTKLLRLEKEDEESELSDVFASGLSKSSGISARCIPENPLISNCDNFNISSTSISKTLEFPQESLNIMESCTKEHNSSFESSASKPFEIAVTTKKNTFQLKRPIKAVLGTDVSKTIEEMWEKDQQMSRTLNSSIDSEHIPKDTFNNNIRTPSSSEKITCMQSNINDRPDKWISTNKPHGKTNNK